MTQEQKVIRAKVGADHAPRADQRAAPDHPQPSVHIEVNCLS